MAAVLEFAGVTVRKGRTTILDDIDWTVEEDERWVIRPLRTVTPANSRTAAMAATLRKR
jgi:hypothetical protein